MPLAREAVKRDSVALGPLVVLLLVLKAADVVNQRKHSATHKRVGLFVVIPKSFGRVTFRRKDVDKATTQRRQDAVVATRSRAKASKLRHFVDFASTKHRRDDDKGQCLRRHTTLRRQSDDGATILRRHFTGRASKLPLLVYSELLSWDRLRAVSFKKNRVAAETAP